MIKENGIHKEKAIETCIKKSGKTSKKEVKLKRI